MSAIQEAVPIEDNEFLSRLFGPDILGKMPRTGQHRVRRTMLCLIGNQKRDLIGCSPSKHPSFDLSGAYASWFTTQASTTPSSAPSLLMSSISYVVAALSEPILCLHAANALRDLCDANRAALALHIGAFAELHSSLTGIPVSWHHCQGFLQCPYDYNLGYREVQGAAVDRQCDSGAAPRRPNRSC
jgi:hypothetical protein